MGVKSERRDLWNVKMYFKHCAPWRHSGWALKPTWWWPRGSGSSRTAGCDRGTRVGSARTAGPVATRAGFAPAQTRCRQTGWAARRQEQAVSCLICSLIHHLVSYMLFSLKTKHFEESKNQWSCLNVARLRAFFGFFPFSFLYLCNCKTKQKVIWFAACK